MNVREDDKAHTHHYRHNDAQREAVRWYITEVVKNAILLSTAALLLAACGSTSTQTSTPPDSTSSLTTLSGKVTGWNKGEATLELRTEDLSGGAQVGSGSVAPDGTVTVTLPTATQIAPALMRAGDSLTPPTGTICTGTLTASDLNANIASIRAINVIIAGNHAGAIYSGADQANVDSLWYADRPVSFSGSQSCNGSFSTTLNFTLKTGWNVVHVQIAGTNSTLTSAAGAPTVWTYAP